MFATTHTDRVNPVRLLTKRMYLFSMLTLEQLESMNVQEKRKMRRWLLPLLFVSMFFAGGCDSDENFETFDGYETLKLSDWNDEWNQYFEDPWVHWETYKNQEGVIVKTNVDDGWYKAIEIEITNPPKGKRGGSYLPINIDRNSLLEGTKVIFSGEARDNSSLDYMGVPLILKNIQIKKNVLID